MRIASLIVASFWTLGYLNAQTATGSIVGRVTDSSGAVIAGVEVSALNPAKGISTRATTDDNGLYRVLYLEPGSYNLTFAKPGFAGVQKTGVPLRSNDTLSIDTQMGVGSVMEKVDVTAQAPLLEAATSTTGTVLSGRQMNALPIQQRYTWMTMYLVPGVTSMNGFHIAGQRDRGLGYTMDGISGTEPIRGGVATNRIMSTTQNAIEEVKMVTTVLPAENGHSAGGLLSATYRSGTNDFHGEAEDRYMNNALKHRDFFQLARPTSPFTYHELAALFTGPLSLPKLYSGKNRTFFLVGWSRHHEKNDTQLFSSVPTPEMLGGDFSFGGIGFPIYDPATTRLNENGVWVRDPFPGNVIPRNRIDPAIAKFLSNQPWKVPNNFGNAGFIDRSGPSQNLGAENRYRSYRTRYDVKIDHVFSEANRMFGRFSHVRNRARGNEIALNWELLDRDFVLTPSDQINGVISDTHLFSPSVISEIRLGVNRRKESRTPGGINEDWAQKLGIPGVSGATFPSFIRSDGNPFYGATMPGGSYYQVTENFTLQENLTVIRGRHAMKTGYELLRTRANTRVASTPGGIYRFGGTDLPFTPNTGNDFAALLLGSVVRADFNTSLANWLPRWWSHAAYFQDDWSISPKLTFNLGVRWSYETPFSTKYGQQSQFDPAAVDPITGRPGAILHPGGQIAKRDLNNFQPRVGAAYRINDRMVFRGGFGLTTIDLFTAALDQNFEEYFTSVAVQPPAGDPRPAFFLSKGPGSAAYNILPNGTSPFVGTNFTGRNATRYDPNMRSPYSMNWNGTYQYQFASSWLMELSYQGSAGVGLLNAWDINAVPLDISRDPVVLNQVFQNYQNYRPFPHFGAVNLWSNFGHSTFHSGTVKIEKRYSRGLTFTSFYTRSKAIDESDSDGVATGVTYYNRRLEKGRAGFDLAHRSVTYVTWELPVGKGRKWMNSGGWLNNIIGNWNLSGVQTFQSGLPATFTVAGSPNRYLPGVVRPNQVLPNEQVYAKDWTLGDRFNNNLKNAFWNLNAFTFPAAFTPGTVGRNTVEGPGMVWTQGSIAKTVKMKERVNLDLRFDINNIFKRPTFNNPSSAVNLVNPGLFGKPTSTAGGFCCLGGQFVGTFVAKLYF
ncbi:MAG TPA: carboxypeptidase regulatory-like domain-containing protein [Bryobacteraceae bacterium]|nr:carboxypeptidase regulatory-like domain-containing protein [Bryobacteraceae bacterium]